jgi:hypothetical protein
MKRSIRRHPQSLMRSQSWVGCTSQVLGWLMTSFGLVAIKRERLSQYSRRSANPYSSTDLSQIYGQMSCQPNLLQRSRQDLYKANPPARQRSKNQANPPQHLRHERQTRTSKPSSHSTNARWRLATLSAVMASDYLQSSRTNQAAKVTHRPSVN